MTENTQPLKNIDIPGSVTPEGFSIPLVNFVDSEGNSSVNPPILPPVKSRLSQSPSIVEAEMIELKGSTGKLLYFHSVKIQIGDVFYLREREQEQTENGIVVQIIKQEAATYAQADSKSLWRLLTTVKAQQIKRAHFESPDIIDLFLSATFKVRAAIIDGKWQSASGRVVTRNVDIFLINPKILLDNILKDQPKVNVELGNFKNEPVKFSGQGFDKVNLITGMKGAGKSHIAKGIIDQSRQCGMSAVVFDINDEYGELPGAIVFKPSKNLKFRLDRVEPKTFLEVIDMLSPFSDRTQYSAIAGIYRLFKERKEKGKTIDLQFLKGQDNLVLPGNATYLVNMRAAYVQSLETVETYNLFMDDGEINQETVAIKNGQKLDDNSLTSAFYNLDQKKEAGVIVFSIGGLLPELQRTIVKLVIDGLKEICDRQNKKLLSEQSYIPTYPTVYFEEAHMYMDREFINRLIPVIRHLGMNLFFVTNTPGELPDSVFRLLDNLVMTRMVNEGDINRVGMCGLTDGDTINSFAPELPEHHALILSAKDGVTQNFPLVFSVQDFNLPKSGVTRSMWRSCGSPRKITVKLMEPQKPHTEEINASRQFENWYEKLQENIPEVSLEPLIEYGHLVRGDSNTSTPVHRWYSLKESYSADLPKWVVNRIKTKYKLQPQEVLDPCVGGGTTGISLGLEGLNVSGVEYNPFIRFVAETKASVYRIDKGELEEAIKELKMKNYSTAEIKIPNMSTLLNRKYVSKKNLNVLLGIQNEIKSLKTSQDIKNLLRLGVAASIEYAFNLRKDGRALRYSPKRAISNITKTVFQKYAEFLVDMENVQKSEHNKGSNVFEVMAGSAVSLRDFEKDGQKFDLADNSFDAVIYSPPYLNNFDYSEVYKLELWLMGFIKNYDAWKTLRLGTIRSHPSIKFSETNNLSGNPATELIHQKLIEMGNSACIPEKRREGVTRTVCGYFDDMYLALREQFRVMKNGAVICYVVANSRHYYLPIATDVILAEIAGNIGFQPLELVTLRKRNGRTRQKTFLRETAVFMKKA